MIPECITKSTCGILPFFCVACEIYRWQKQKVGCFTRDPCKLNIGYPKGTNTSGLMAAIPCIGPTWSLRHKIYIYIVGHFLDWIWKSYPWHICMELTFGIRQVYWEIVNRYIKSHVIMITSSTNTLPETNIAMENPQFWWYLPGKMVIFMGYVSFREGRQFSTRSLD